MTQEKREKLKKKAHRIQMKIHHLVENYQSNSPKSKALQLKLFRIHLKLYNPTKYDKLFKKPKH